MNYLGIEVDIKNKPLLDPEFIPIGLFNRAFLKTARKPVAFAVERDGGQIAVTHTFIHGTPDMAQADAYYAERLVKQILWMKGGFRIYVSGDEGIYRVLKDAYTAQGSRGFDVGFMSDVYECPIEVVWCDKIPEEKGASQAVGRHLEGCRIGFDAGGSDRKVSAVIDGEPVYSEETVWFPKLNEDPQYHYDGIVDSLKAAAAKMPRVDAVGVSSAGVYINNRPMVASLFLKVPRDRFHKEVKDIYMRAVRDTFGPDVPVVVCNDGDVTALAGAMGLGENGVLGIAMGTSEAVGYVDDHGNITGWLNELAFMPVDANPTAMADEWSGDIGCGVKYFSQDGVIKLAPRAGIILEDGLSPAEKLKVVQKLMEEGSDAAAKVYTSIGTYLGHTLAYYYELYGYKHVLLLGRVMSGKGGDLILQEAKRVLTEEYPEYADRFIPALPDEKARRVGQSVAAASLPEL